VSFALDGVSYEIDVSEANAAKLRDALAPWVGHARRVGGRSGGGGGTRARSGGGSGGGSGRSRGNSKHDLSDVRSWARENGFQVSDRGRVSSEVIAAYEKAH
jgi:nucleoid-associated protein Lsr2